MLHHGPVRVPADARPGNATLRVELPPDAGFASLPTDLTVELAAGPSAAAK